MTPPSTNTQASFWISVGGEYGTRGKDDHCENGHPIPAGTKYLRLPHQRPGGYTHAKLCGDCALQPHTPAPAIDPFDFL